MEFLLAVAAVATFIEAALPPLMAVQKEVVRHAVQLLLSVTYVAAFGSVVFSVKKRLVQQRLFEAERLGAPPPAPAHPALRSLPVATCPCRTVYSCSFGYLLSLGTFQSAAHIWLRCQCMPKC